MSLKHSISVVFIGLSLFGAAATSLANANETAVDPDAASLDDTASAPTPAGSALLTQLVTGSFDLGTADNLAGVLDYCSQNDLADDEVAATGNELIDSLGGRDELAQQTDFASGQQGILISEQDRRYTLEGANSDTQRGLCTHLADKAHARFLSDNG